MRQDMPAVIVERPRWGLRHCSRGVPGERNASIEVLPTKEGMRRRHTLNGTRRELNENLRPLERYLRKQVGRPWNAVYRDICARLRPTSAVQLHVRQHLWDYVERDVTLDAAGRVCGSTASFTGEILPLRPGQLFAHPTHGLLCCVRRRR
jgi:hypothetical protein